MGSMYSLLCKKEGEWTCFDDSFYLTSKRTDVLEQVRVAKELGYDDLRIQEWQPIQLGNGRSEDEHIIYQVIDTEGNSLNFSDPDTFFRVAGELEFEIAEVNKYILIKEDVA
jgi:hypothetical protein